MALASENTNILRFQRTIEKKYGVHFETYFDFHKWSVEHYAETWAEAFEFFEFKCSQPYTQIIEPNKSIEDLPEWFIGARLNFTENMLRHEKGNALLLLGEERCSAEKVTFVQLRDEVATISAALRKAGVGKGDVIACHMSTRKEAVVAMMAAGAIGAMFTTVNPLMAAQAIINRFQQVGPKVLFTIDRHLYGGEEKDILKDLSKIVESLPTLEHVIIIPSNEHSLQKNISIVPKSTFYPDFLRKGLKENETAPEPYYEQLPFNHPFIISYTSGTTGLPKGIVHSAGAALLGHVKEMAFNFDVQPEDIMFAVHLLGWVSFNIFSAPLTLGACIVLYEGLPYFRRDPSFWDLIETYGITSAFLTPTVIEEMNSKDLVPGPNNSLKSLRILLSGASPVKAHVFDIVQNRIKKDLFFSMLYGCTEYFTMTAGSNPNLPVHKEELQATALGLDILCYDETGQNVFDQLGELVVKNPCPTLPLYKIQEKKYEKYTSDSFKKFPGAFWVGDYCIKNSKTGGLLVPGRCDDTVKNLGARFGSSEIYCVVNVLKEVDDSLCVSRIDRTGHEVAVLFIKMKPGKEFTPQFIDFVKQRIKEELSFRHVPETILQVKNIPVNLNGKKMEILVKKIMSQMKDLPLDAVMNPESLEEYKQYAVSIY